MKINTIIILILALLASCKTSQKFQNAKYYFSDSISFTVKKVKVGHVVGASPVYYVSGENTKLVFITLKVKNETNTKIPINFYYFSLADNEMKNKTSMQLFQMAGPITIFAKPRTHLGKRASKSRQLVFAVSQTEKLGYLMVNKNVIQINYE